MKNSTKLPLYREPLVLCYLEGLTRDEAAARLGVSLVTLNKQLERGRKKLADALTARGCTLGVTLLATVATSVDGRGTPARLMDCILAAVGGSPSKAAATLAKGIAMNGLLMRAKLLMLAVAGTAVMGFGYSSMFPAIAEPQLPNNKKAVATDAANLEAKKSKPEPKKNFRSRASSSTPKENR